jgi:FkbM family methyltransferase
MNPIGAIKARIPPSVKRLAKRFTRDARLARSLCPFVPEVICVDVGASYFPHVKWRLLLESARTRWVAVEPNKANLAYVDTWAWPSQVSTCTTGLSRNGGAQTLYITNIDSGSSLLAPLIPAGLSGRVRNLDYFFPVRTQSIQTLTLCQVIEGIDSDAPVFVKLDTQGTELSILSGAETLIRSRRIIGVELEATLLAQPIMQGAGKFWQACQYLEELGLELLHIHPIYGPSRFGRLHPGGVTYINECDAVFAVRPDIMAALSVQHRAAMFTFYLCNRMYEEAQSLLADDLTLKAFLAGRGCCINSLASAISALA